MKYFKNTELAKLYKISEKSVRNWIDAARQGKLDLELIEQDDKAHIANTSKNTFLIEMLVENGKKYKNGRGFKYIKPTTTFYQLYDAKQVLDIISNIDIHREIPYQYTYFDGGAKHWDLYTQRLLQENSSNYLKDIVELVDSNIRSFERIIPKDAKINIIDLGVGNCLPVRNLLQYFVDKNRLKRYIGIDISKDMLNIAERNVNEWFGEKLKFEGYVRDINYDRFNDLLSIDSFDTTQGPTVNLVIFFGGTIANLRDPEYVLRVINDSMGKGDLLIFCLKLDSEKSRRYFDFTTISGGPANIFRGKDLLDILNIDESAYDVEQFFDKTACMRKTQVKLKIALSLEFQVNNRSKTIELNKGDTLLLWRARHQSVVDTINQFDKSDFELLQTSRSTDEEHLLTVSRIKTSSIEE